MTTTTTYRKTKTGEWVAYGPARIVRTGTITVTKKDGSTKTETVAKVGRSFQVAGIEMVYGYLAQRQSANKAHSHSSGSECDNCGAPCARYNARDLSGISGRVCGSCYGDRDSLSFA